MKTWITVEATIDAPIEKVWKFWNEPEHIVNWCFASDDWCAPHATNDLRTGGTFNTRMESRDGTVGFDMAGEYMNVVEGKLIEYVFGDRHAKIEFISGEAQGGVKIIESFEAEDENPLDMQKAGWQSILNNFKKYVEGN